MKSKPLSLNRFPLFALWVKAAAMRLGYTEAEAKSLGYGYALLGAIRKSKRYKRTGRKKYPQAGSGFTSEVPYLDKDTSKERQSLHIFGESIYVIALANGKIRAAIGGPDEIQTPYDFDNLMKKKFSGDKSPYLAKLEKLFDEYFKGLSSYQANSKMVYSIYSQWRDQCKYGFNLVNLDSLLEWMRENS